MPTSKNSTLSNLEDNLFSMSEKESSLLSEAIMTQTDVDCLLNDESLNTSEATTGDGAIHSVTLDDNGGASTSRKRRRGKDKAASPDRRPKEVSNKLGKAADKTKTKEGAQHASKPSNKTNNTVRSEKGGKTTASTLSAADAADITQLSNILQSSLSSAFAGLTASLKTGKGFADLGKLIQDSKRPEAQESGSETGDSGDEDSDKNESDEPPAKRQKAADSSPAIIEKLTKDLALEDEKGPTCRACPQASS
ncbi:bromodomain and WD repeat-containing DDB_G0285837-like [Montipora foliosa]|uniref:bromodomain and WD repeat-containing DDB_G0285837-like n=1 Tax=Montipora foliosa TaxID=591990 RepID=UPI0035F193D7